MRQYVPICDHMTRVLECTLLLEKVAAVELKLVTACICS